MHDSASKKLLELSRTHLYQYEIHVRTRAAVFDSNTINLVRLRLRARPTTTLCSSLTAPSASLRPPREDARLLAKLQQVGCCLSGFQHETKAPHPTASSRLAKQSCHGLHIRGRKTHIDQPPQRLRQHLDDSFVHSDPTLQLGRVPSTRHVNQPTDLLHRQPLTRTR
jgi:hypothetical protein